MDNLIPYIIADKGSPPVCELKKQFEKSKTELVTYKRFFIRGKPEKFPEITEKV